MMKLRILQKRIETLEELYPKITRGLVQIFENSDEPKQKMANSDEFNDMVYKYRDTKGKILMDLMNESVFRIENEYLAQLRKKLQKLTIHGDPNIPDEFLDDDHEALRRLLLDLLKPEIPDSKIEELALDYRMSFSEYDYVYNKMRANLLVIKAGTIPESLERYIDEIRECLALWRHLAATILLRTSLEISIQDLCQQNGLDDKDDTNLWNQKLDFWEDRLREEKIDSRLEWDLNRITLENQINLLGLMDKFSPHLTESHELRIELNKIVHNEIDLDRKVSIDLTHRTFQLIHELYEAN